MKRTRTIILSILIITVVLPGIGSGNPSRDIYRQVRKNQSLINDVYRQLVTNYVDDIDLDAFTKLSINNMLRELDPYTTYMEKQEKDGIEMLTKGKYGGVGIQIGIREKELTVISPIDNSPAKKAGIMSGDKIIGIDSVKTKDYSIDDAAKLIRGRRGTEVVLTIKRYGEPDVIKFVLIRENIAVKDISYFGMLNESTGYIRLTRFSRNSDKEMLTAIDSLLSNNMTGLILDLRDNPGGLLNSAVNILDLLVDKGEILVWTEGKTSKSAKKYYSQNDPIVPDNVNIVVLVNQGSASASEIISGTLQDLDRGVVIGRKTYGKGLVQTVFNLDRERAIKITTAKYYIPSGRLIQKPGYLPQELLGDSTDLDTLYYTKGGRKVSGSGGITPDHEIELDEITPLLSASWRQGLFFNFVQKHKSIYTSLNDVEEDTSLLNKFEEYLYTNDLDIYMKGENVYLDLKDMLLELDSTSVQIQGALDIMDDYFEQIALNQFDKEREKLNHYLLLEFADYFDGEEGRIKLASKKDRDILKALELFHDPVVYEKIFLPQ